MVVPSASLIHVMEDIPSFVPLAWAQHISWAQSRATDSLLVFCLEPTCPRRQEWQQTDIHSILSLPQNTGPEGTMTLGICRTLLHNSILICHTARKSAGNRTGASGLCHMVQEICFTGLCSSLNRLIDFIWLQPAKVTTNVCIILLWPWRISWNLSRLLTPNPLDYIPLPLLYTKSPN